MAASNINSVVVTGNLTRDPELRHTPGGTPVCKLRIAVNTRRKSSDGNWEDKPNYFDVTVWGAQGENCSTYLVKGRPVAISGRLEWREWEGEGGKRQAVEIIAETVQFLGSRDGSSGGGGNGNGGGGFAGGDSGLPADTSDFDSPAPASVGSSSDDDIPF
jgi:single-strand DNA-binding protein